MGFLHEGHLALFRHARANNDVAVASIFVNPTQFGPNEDLSRYPRDTDGDLAKASACGIDFVWMPEVADMYRPGATTRVRVDGLTRHLCGASRPGHFEGVATIVAKLFNVVQPTAAYFGEKDYQQLAVIRQMALDLDFDVAVVGLPTIREADGLAMSSRNKFLSETDRTDALLLSRALQQARVSWAGGEGTAESVRAALQATLCQSGGVRVDYAELCDPTSLEPLLDEQVAGSAAAVALVAAYVGSTRLIDNMRLD